MANNVQLCTMCVHMQADPRHTHTPELNFISDFSLQQLGDAAVSLIILIAFSLVAAGASNYIVNERVSGEKLQQRLSDVSFKTYWGVNFMWDFTVSVNKFLGE